MLNDLPYYMLRSLCFTLLIELTFALVLGVRRKKDFFNIAAVNVMTNPLVVSVMFVTGFLYGGTARRIATIVLELLAFALEALVYKKTLQHKKINPFLLSLLLNGASYGIGEIINRIL